MIKKMDEVLAAIAAGKTNTEIRDQIDGRIGDKAINQLRKHPANADVPWPEDALKAEAAMKARAEAAAAEDKVPFTPEEPEETAAEEPETASAAPAEEPEKIPRWERLVAALAREIDPPMSIMTAIRKLALYVVEEDPDQLIAAALDIKDRLLKEKGRAEK